MVASGLIIISSLFFPGIIGKVKAKMQGRKGPVLLQPWFDIIKLLKKGSVYSDAGSFVFKLSAPLYLAAILAAIMLIPFGAAKGVISFEGDFIFFAYMLALGRFILIAAALDTGSGFEGMGANREALYSMLAEPAFFALLGALALFTGYTSFETIFSHLHFTSYLSAMIAVLALYLFTQIILVENSRLPVDDPKTHLELTMVHEVMVLDHSGFDLGLIQIANAMKFTVFGALIANCVTPFEWHSAIQVALFLGIQAGLAVTTALLESFRARNKMARNPHFLLTLSAVAIVLFFTVLIINHNL